MWTVCPAHLILLDLITLIKPNKLHMAERQNIFMNHTSGGNKLRVSLRKGVRSSRSSAA